MSSSGSTPARFVVLFQGRTGSTYFIEGLDSHPAIRARGEVLVTIELISDSAGQLRWIDEFLRSRPPGVSAIGFKTKLKDVLDQGGLSRLLREHDTRIILMQRRNLIKWVVSFFNSVRIEEETGDWNLYRTDDRPPPFRIDPDTFDSWLGAVVEKKRLLDEFVAGLGLQTLGVEYEEILKNEASVWKKAFSFLEVPHAGVEGRCIKSTSDDLRECVLNFEELRERYVGSGYEVMFDEVLIR